MKDLLINPVLKARESWKINWGAASRNASKRPKGKASPLILEISELFTESWVSMQAKDMKRRIFLKISLGLSWTNIRFVSFFLRLYLFWPNIHLKTNMKTILLSVFVLKITDNKTKKGKIKKSSIFQTKLKIWRHDANKKLEMYENICVRMPLGILCLYPVDQRVNVEWLYLVFVKIPNIKQNRIICIRS